MYIFKPKIPIWVNFGGSSNGRSYFMAVWSILRPFGIGILWPFGLFYGHLVYLRPLGIFCGHLVNVSRFGMLYQEKSGNPGQERMPSIQRSWDRSQLTKNDRLCAAAKVEIKNVSCGRTPRIEKYGTL
jgi:hypothetical protein